MPLDLTVLIVSFNTRDLLESCLRSLLRATSEAHFDVVVVDNASADAAWEVVEGYFPGAKVIKLDRNIGFAAAVNRGLGEVHTDFTFILNPDTVIPRGSVRKLLDFLLKNPSAAVVGASLTDLDGTPQTSTFKFPSLFREFWNFLPELKSAVHLRQAAVRLGWARTNPSRADGTGGIPVQSVSGAAFMARTEAIRRIGGFDERFFLYHEEMDLCTRLRKAGWGVFFLPAAQVIHWEAGASGYRPSRLPDMPLLGWRVGGMDLLWSKHQSRLRHRLWRGLARSLLGLRVLTNRLLTVFCGRRRVQRQQRIRDLAQALGLLRRKLDGERGAARDRLVA
jgi:N-acetylglucosaminyl-diphospho-decaprenol L-rhamnosyltransferase